jgi:hypothetical protein
MNIQLDKEIILENNKIISKFMGIDFTTVESAHKYSVYIRNNHGRYHNSWDWLMPVVRKINELDKATQISIFKTYVSCSVETSTKFRKDFSFAHSEYITNEQTDIQAVWILVSKFIVWYYAKLG